MKKNTFLSLLAVAIIVLPFATLSQAMNLEEIKQNKESVSQQTEELNGSLTNALSQVNEKYQQVADLQKELDKTKDQLQKYNVEIAQTEESIKIRKEVVAEQMKQMQLNNQQNSFLDILFSSENLSEMINRSVAMNTIRSAQTEKITSLAEAKEKLQTLKEKADKAQKQLIDKSVQKKREASELEAEVTALQVQVAKNQDLMQQLSQQEKSEQTRIAEEAARKKREEQIVQQTSNNTSSQSTTQKAPNAPAPSQPVSTGEGRTLNVQATGYSCQEAGLTWHTATGIDLRQNPNVIAVDPRVIPLGTLVEVPGYGVAVAGDTGGAIIGNIIDLHFPTVQQAWDWGRRNVTIKILS